MTPCEALGYKVGDKFRPIQINTDLYHVGDILELANDDGTYIPSFNNITTCINGVYIHLDELEKISNDNLDFVDHPPHYNQGEIECIDAIRSMLGDEGFIAYCRGNAMKYTWRMMHKGKKKEDCEKAQWYLNRINDLEI